MELSEVGKNVWGCGRVDGDWKVPQFVSERWVKFFWGSGSQEIWRNWQRWQSSILMLTLRSCRLRQRWQVKDVKDHKFAGSGSQKDIMRCLYDGRGHKAVDCPTRASTSRNELNDHRSRFRRSCCCKCGSTGHHTTDCRKSLQRTHSTQQRLGVQDTGGISTQCRGKQKAKRGMDTLELKTGGKIKVLNGACLEAELRDNLPVMSGRWGTKT